MPEMKISIAYDHPRGNVGCSTGRAWAKKPRETNPEERVELIARIKRLLKEQDAVLVAH